MVNPRTFNEKVNWRISFDRRSILVHTCDKLAMKEHARDRANGLVRIPDTYWFGTDVAELADVELPDHWVLKPNHASQLVHLGQGAVDVAELAEVTRGWVELDYSAYSLEWAYTQARAGLLVEEFIGEPGESPADLKVTVFDGVPRLVSVHTGRADGARIRLYTPDWQPLPWMGERTAGPDAPPPERLADMLTAAAALAAGYDMMRVDFYEHDGELWFGELTPYPGAGTSRLGPEMDAVQGSWWTLPAIRWRRLTRFRG